MGVKDKIRSEIRKKALSMTEADRREASRIIAGRVLSLPQWEKANTVFLYWSLPTEPDTSALREAAIRQGKTVLLPRCEENGSMDAVRWTPETVMLPGPYHIPYPEGPAYDGSPDLAVIPCVSATRDGIRLGHGAGYYDRYLAEHDVFSVCLCFSALLSDSLPAEPHDSRASLVVTERR